ncbi:MAG: FHA domain-containing protein, partial [Mogibacterium sp.]|nr:FHA domain-containing protein [Mogibacterium sp.]
AAIANEADQADWKSTQVLSADESEALAAAVEAASEAQSEAAVEGKAETQVGEPFEAPAEEPAEEIEAAIASEESQPDWKSTQVLSADESEALEAAVEAADEDLVGSVFADEGTFKIEDQQDEEQATKTLILTWIDDITGETKKLKIDHFPFAIGRKSDVNDYTIARKGISRKHMHFDELDGEVYVYDEASTNGVRLNGEKITPETQVKLRSGDHIRVLDITFVVTID